MSKELKKYKVTIAGESYFLVSDEPEEHIKYVADCVDAQMRSIAQSGYSDDPQRLAVLVALQNTSKMMKDKDLIAQYKQYTEKMIEHINTELAK